MNRFDKASEILLKASRSGSRLGLERIYELAARLEDPQDKLRVVHVAGTNGKGSFSAMLSSVLHEAGFKVGTFSSPAMLTPCDQYRINGEIISKDQFADAIITVNEAALTMADPPTEFELMTAAAYYLFDKEQCDIAVIECGMGGDGDSTNIIRKPLMSVITNVALDHCAYLGNTTSEIAGHKAGIIKEGVPCYFGGEDEQAYKVISYIATQKGSKLYTPDLAEFKRETTLSGETQVTYKDALYRTPLRGSYQVRNLINVISCVEILRFLGVEISDGALSEGLMNVRWEGRFEQLCSEPDVIFDGAHNPDGMEQLCRSISMYYPDVKPAILIGVLADKDYRLYCRLLRPLVCRAFTIAPENHRALSSEALAECFNEGGIPSESYKNISEGFEAACSYAARESIPLLVIGSLYLYKDIKECAEKHLTSK